MSIALAMHPWAIMGYDSDLEIHKGIIDTARKEGIDIVSYGEVVENVNSLTS